MKKLNLLVAAVISITSLYAQAEIISAEDKQLQVDAFFESGKPLTLYNFKLQKDVTIERPHRMTAIEGLDYIPDIPEARQIFDMFISKGAKPMEAISYTYAEMMDVLQGGEQ